MTPFEIATTVILGVALALLGWMERNHRAWLRRLDEQSDARRRRP